MQEPSPSRTAKLIAELWRKNQPQILDRLAQLDSAAAAAQAGTLTEAQRDGAEGMAHKLAGSLGMFGYPAGTNIARALEDEFHRDSPDAAVLKTLTRELRDTLFPSTDS
jgi:HPt (histidine-containing phosphotransfer) domain-containing protein